MQDIKQTVDLVLKISSHKASKVVLSSLSPEKIKPFSVFNAGYSNIDLFVLVPLAHSLFAGKRLDSSTAANLNIDKQLLRQRKQI